MAKIVSLNSFSSEVGDLTVFQGHIPGFIKRVYYISNVPKDVVRGGHRHHKTWQGLVCIKGSCRVLVDDSVEQVAFELKACSSSLIVEPKDWHIMKDFSEDCVLLVIANENYDKNDYIDKPYRELKIK